MKFRSLFVLVTLLLAGCQVGDNNKETIQNYGCRTDLSIAMRIFPSETNEVVALDVIQNEDRVYTIKYLYLRYLLHLDDRSDYDFFDDIFYIADFANIYFGFPDVAAREWLSMKENDKLSYKLSVYYFYIIYMRSSMAFAYFPDDFGRAFWKWFMNASNNNVSYVYLHPDLILAKLNSYGFLNTNNPIMRCVCDPDYFD